MPSNNIRMRVNYDSECVCSECGMKYKNTKEMYDMKIFGEVHHICYDCLEALFLKTLRAQTTYQAKLKTKEDMARIKRNELIKNS